MEESEKSGPVKWKRLLHRIAMIFIIIFGIVFTLLNPSMVEVDFVARTVSLPLSILIFVCFGLGLIIGLLIGYARSWRRFFPSKS